MPSPRRLPLVNAADGPPLRLDRGAHEAMIAHAFDGHPHEACGLLGGVPGAQTIGAFCPARNVDESAMTYSLGPEAFAAAEAEFEPLGYEIVGVMHSHTHTDAYPSPTDIAKADNPFLTGWKFVIVSLRDLFPSLRSYVLDEGVVVEERVEFVDEAVDGESCR